MMAENKQGYLSSEKYWGDTWKANRRRKSAYRRYLPWVDDWFKYQKRVFPAGADIKLLEVGCAASRVIPIYISEFSYQVTGVDYDQFGCELAQNNLREHELSAEIIRDDFFTYSTINSGKFDIVVSYGFIEHFDGELVINAMKNCLKKGGVLFAEVPNLQGLQGLLFRTVFNFHKNHIVYSPVMLEDLFKKCGMSSITSSYAGGLGVPIPKGVQGLHYLFTPLHILMWMYLSATLLLSKYTGFRLRGKNFSHSIMVSGLR